MSTVTLGRDGQQKVELRTCHLASWLGWLPGCFWHTELCGPISTVWLCVGLGNFPGKKTQILPTAGVRHPPPRCHLPAGAPSCCDCGLLMARCLFPSPEDCPWLSLRLHIISREAACNRLIHGDRRSAPGFKVGLKLCCSSASRTAQEIRLRLISSGDHTQT